MEVGFEFLSGDGRGRRSRKWPDEAEAWIVSEILLPDAMLNDVARRHGVPASHVSSWRTLARKGRLVLPAPENPGVFAALLVGSVGDAPRVDVETGFRAEILTGAVVIRLEHGAQVKRIASFGRALAASP